MTVKCNIDFYDNNYQHLKQVDYADIIQLFSYDYYDGDLSGACEYNGFKCWFVCVDMASRDDKSYYRRYIIIKLTDIQWSEIHCKIMKYEIMAGYDSTYSNIPETQIYTTESRKQYFLEEDNISEFIVEYEKDSVLGYFE